jgi:UMF1 family MFS transporter
MPGPPLLERLGLRTPELRAWVLYDWANSVFMTTVLQVFPIYFATVAAADLAPSLRSERFAITTSLSIALVALVSPLLGALADVGGRKKSLLAAFAFLGAAATAGMVFVERGDWALGAVLFGLGNIGAVASIVFYNALLPHIARVDEVDRTSTAGFALGYVSGGLVLALNLLFIQRPELFGLSGREAGFRLSFLCAAVWWAAFTLPVLLRVPEPPARVLPGEDAAAGAVSRAWARLRRTLGEARRHPDAVLVLVAFLIYNDGINTIIRMATLFGSGIGIPAGSLILAILMVQFVGVPFAFLFGQLAGRIGAKRAVLIALLVYVVISLLGSRMQGTRDFFVLAFLVGTVMGGAQALSRSLFASMVPRSQSAQLFGFFGVFDKFGGVFGSALFAVMARLTGSSRPAILAIAAFFVVGALILSRVDVERGRRAAAEG